MENNEFENMDNVWRQMYSKQMEINHILRATISLSSTDRVSLPDQVILELIGDVLGSMYGVEELIEFVRRIEKAHGITE
jgi:hypothetical protein